MLNFPQQIGKVQIGCRLQSVSLILVNLGWHNQSSKLIIHGNIFLKVLDHCHWADGKEGNHDADDGIGRGIKVSIFVIIFVFVFVTIFVWRMVMVRRYIWGSFGPSQLLWLPPAGRRWIFEQKPSFSWGGYLWIFFSIFVNICEDILNIFDDVCENLLIYQNICKCQLWRRWIT